MPRWPNDRQADLIRFFGKPGPAIKGKLVRVTPPFKIYYGGREVRTVQFHALAADALTAALEKIWDYYDHDQAKIDELGISKFAGTYNHRMVRGSKTKWSNHAYGTAYDMNAEENGFNVAGNIPIPVIAAFKSEEFAWGGDYKGRKDPMHFEACYRGDPKLTFEQWIVRLGGMLKDGAQEGATAEAEDIDFAPTDISASARAPGKPLPFSVPVAALGAGVYDKKIEDLQNNLIALEYFEVGRVDGMIGSRTIAAIAAFNKDWKRVAIPPVADDATMALVAQAVAENWTRPINPARKDATSGEVAKVIPEMATARKSKLGAMWASITSFFVMVFAGISEYFKEALAWLTPAKQFFADIPGPVWFGAAGIVAAVLFYYAGRTSRGIQTAFQKGERL